MPSGDEYLTGAKIGPRLAATLRVQPASRQFGQKRQWTRVYSSQRFALGARFNAAIKPAGRMEAAIKKLTAVNKRKLVGKTGTEVRKILLG
jgi:predicted GIY-YIG superfamily endonuclease